MKQKARVAPTTSPVALSSLTPDFDEDQHRTYVDHLKAALETPRIRNIALTGRYGAGKSSVLEKFQKEVGARSLFLSMSTLGPAAEGETRTSQIQKELVKQLLHHARPAALPQSRFKRIRRRNLPKAIGFSAVQVAIVLAILAVLGLVPNFSQSLEDAHWALRALASLGVWAGLTGALTWLKVAVHDRIISSISAAGTTVSLAETEDGSYFDKYLDEIIYFFETHSSLDVVVFEDLDRFNDPGIFEDLRELNTLLNNSQQMGARSIRFVYALRDSIFERLGFDSASVDGPAAAEAVRANRTKFFELVVPVVPFITHRTSRDLLDRLIKDSGAESISPELVDLTAKHLPDMRLLKNIRNEYVIFSQRLIGDQKGIEGLEPDSVFAMVAYKNVHLDDFEKLLLGQSNLDKVYRHSRDLINSAIAANRGRIRGIDDQTSYRSALAEKLSEVSETLDWRVDIFRQTHRNQPVDYYLVGDSKYDAVAPGRRDFWEDLSDPSRDLTVVLEPLPNTRAARAIIPRADLDRLFGESIGLGRWETSKVTQLTRERETLGKDIAALKVADFEQLLGAPTRSLTVAGESQPFRDLATNLLGPGLAVELMAEGYIDRNFALYASQYYGERVSTNAMNFVLQHANADEPDANYPLNNDDVVGVLLETNRSFLGETSSYNIALLDWLIEYEGLGVQPGALTVLDALVRSGVGAAEAEFLNAYLADGGHTDKVVQYISPRLPSVFALLTTRIELSAANRLALVDVALRGAEVDIDYDLDDDVVEYLRTSLTRLPVLHEPSSDAEAEAAVALLNRAGVEVEDISALDSTARRHVIEQAAYALSSTNLTAVTGSESIALDAVRAADEQVYRRCLDELPRYIEILQARQASPGPTADSRSIDDATRFADVVANLDDAEGVAADAIIKHSATGSRVDDLAAAPEFLRDPLVKHQRVAATLDNVATYINHVGEVNADLAELLKVSGISVPETGEDDPSGIADRKVSVAEKVLAASSVLDANARASLVASLYMGDYLEMTHVPAEHGPLLGLLIEGDVCPDTAQTFSHFDLADWPTLRGGILASDEFSTFLSPELVDRDCAARLLDDSAISEEVKRALLPRLQEFIHDDHGPALKAAAKTALALAYILPPDEVVRIGSHVQNPNLILKIVNAQAEHLTNDEALAVLATQGEPYDSLREAGAHLTFTRDSPHETVLDRFKSVGRITTRAYAKSMTKPARIEVIVK